MLTYIKESHRTRGVRFEEVLCDVHLAEVPVAHRTPHERDKDGYRLEVREWTGGPVECSQCGLAPEFKGIRSAIVALLFFLLMPALVGAQGVSGPIVFGAALDAVSTEIALQRPGLREGNPLLGQSAPRRLILKSAGTVGQVWLTRKLDKAGHPKLARVVGYSIGAWGAVIAVRNLRQGR